MCIRDRFIAIFDADFVPEPSFLRLTIPYLATDPGLGAVQARWGHLNATDSPLTGAQAIALDKHFAVEQVVRHRAACFPKFNGSAGVWRRTCIEDAGGWQADTLCAQLSLIHIFKEALANGRLTDRNTAPEFAASRRLLRQAAEDGGIAVDTLALAAVLAQPWVGVVLSGAARVEHLASNAAAVAVATERTAWLAEWLPRLNALVEPAESYWQQRAALAWN